jgi:hypothetical protein
MPRRAPLAAAAALALAAAPARAIDRFEIQVYEGDLNDPGQFGLEVHLNYTVRGTKEPEFPGQVPPHHVGRVTFEPAVGVTEWLELGAYLQFFWAPNDDQGTRFGGWKARAKLIVPERIRGPRLLLGLNLEIGHVPTAVEEQGWANEFRPIIGWKGDRWLVVVNPIFGYALSGPDKFRPDLEPCAKVAFDTRLGFSIGAEYYTSLGFANDLLPASEQEHLLFAVVDLVPRAPEPQPGSQAHGGEWELNAGVGWALTDAPGPHLLVKAIVGRSF